MKKFNYKEMFDNDNYQKGLRVVIICALAVIIVVACNLLMSLVPTETALIDVSNDKVHSIGDDTKAMLSEVTDDITIYLVAQKGNEDLNAEITLNLYADSSDHIVAQRLDQAYDIQTIKQYSDDVMVDDNTVIVASKDRAQIIKYADYYSGNTYILEDYLNSAIKYVTSEGGRKVYFVSGHDEQEVTKDVLGYIGLDGYETGNIDLSLDAIPEDCSLLVINGPQKDLTEAELEKLMAYVEAGRNVLLTTDYTKSTLNNLMSFTKYFGAELGKGLLAEQTENKYINGNPSCILPLIHVDNNATLTEGLEYVAMPSAKPIVIDEDDKTVKVQTILEASETSFAAYKNELSGQTEATPGPFPVEIYVEKNDTNAKLIWFSSMYISNASINEYVGGGNVTAFLNAICYLGSDEAVASIHGKSTSTKYLSLTNQNIKVWRNIMIFVIPAIVILLGVFVVIRRRRR